MGVFPEFGRWINQSIQQPPKAESKRSENVESNSEPPMDANLAEDRRQTKLWMDAEKKHPWYDPPPKLKVTTKNGLCHMNIELTVGLPPGAVFEKFTSIIPIFAIDRAPTSGFFFLPLYVSNTENKSRKVLKKDGLRRTAKLEKAVAWDFLWWSGSLPITLIVDENEKDLTTKYKKEKMMFMKVFQGNYKVEPIYVDSKRLCKQREPKNQEEYKNCSGGQGKIASKVIVDQYFQPYFPFNLPPFSWYIRDITINTTMTLVTMLQNSSKTNRGVHRKQRS